MYLQIRRRKGAAADPDGPGLRAMAVRPDCTLRMYRDIPPAGWPAFCDPMPGLFNEADG